jgi:16S rRNA (guanine966-N2)-methyltransferase
LRIISGTARGLQLSALPGKSRAIRPTSDRAREALFSILGDRVGGAQVLDLYAGTGALGIEALSRGARSALFVDNSKAALSLLTKNIAAYRKCIGLDSIDQPTTRIIKADLAKRLPGLKDQSRKEHILFDIIFLDPPYDKDLALKTLCHLDSLDMISSDSLIIAEERASVTLPAELKNILCIDKRRYGDTAFWFYKLR